MVPTGMTSHVHAFDAFRISLTYDRLPPGLSTADNEVGWRSSLAKLAALVEAR